MIAYLDLPAGISGDMFLGCLVDAGWPIAQLQFTLARLKLPVEECSVAARRVQKGVLAATLVEVNAQEGHHHRHLADVKAIIQSSDLPTLVQNRAIAVFQRLAEAEAKVHGTTPEKIHFHEVGAVDAIADIVGVVTGLHELGIDKLYASAVPLGSGWAKTEHGQIPLPAPATLELLAAAKATTRPAPGPGEHVTPTGAALLAELATFQQPTLTLTRIGYGAGQRDCAWPNVARLWLGEAVAGTGSGGMVQLDTNIDDMNPQLYAAVSEKLFAAGAKDVWFTPIQMKKNRPAVLLSALGTAQQEANLAQVILQETTTLGVRVHALDHRHEARREIHSVATPFGAINIKVKFIGNQASGAMPEYEDVRLQAETAKVSTREVYETATVAGQALLAKLRDAAVNRDPGDRG
ncbi:MAG: nickel pincer cofactor biosynthesis protein LarC [Phycisphaerae bacterium]